MTETPTIHQAMGAILAEMPAIGKTQKNVQQNFMFRGHDDVLNALNPLLAKHGVFITPYVLERVTGKRETAKGSTMYEVNLHVRFQFHGPAGDWVEASGWGEGTDMGDKATSKAMTMAFKYVLGQVFAVSTAAAADPDGQQAEHTRHVPENSRSQPEVRVTGPGEYPVPKTWAKVKETVLHCDNEAEAWQIFEAFGRAAGYHLFGETDAKKRSKEQNQVILQKAAGAAVWMHDQPHAGRQGEFLYFTEDVQRQAWAAVLDGTLLEIPDYTAPEAEPTPEEQAEAERLRLEYEAAIQDIE